MKVIILGVSSVKIVILEMMESGVSQYWDSLDCNKIWDTCPNLFTIQLMPVLTGDAGAGVTWLGGAM